MSQNLTAIQIEARRQNIQRLIDSAGSTIFAVNFVKKDGSERLIQVQTPAIKKLLVGDAASEVDQQRVATRKANNPNLLAVFDIAIQAIRSINLDTVLSLTVRGTRYEVGATA